MSKGWKITIASLGAIILILIITYFLSPLSETYTTHGPSVCPGLSPDDSVFSDHYRETYEKCLYYFNGDRLKDIVEYDKQYHSDTSGCALPAKYKYCDFGKF